MSGLPSATSVAVNQQLQNAYAQQGAAAPALKILQTSLNQSKSLQLSNQVSKQADISAMTTSTESESSARDSVRVSSSLGKAASKGQLTKAEALAIYEKIASFL